MELKISKLTFRSRKRKSLLKEYIFDGIAYKEDNCIIFPLLDIETAIKLLEEINIIK